MSSTSLHCSSYRQHTSDNNEDLEEEADQNTNKDHVDGQIMTDDTIFQGNDLPDRQRSPFTMGSPIHQPSGAKMHEEPLLRSTTAFSESSEREPLLERIPRINAEENQSLGSVHGMEITVLWNEVRFSHIQPLNCPERHWRTYISWREPSYVPGILKWMRLMRRCSRHFQEKKDSIPVPTLSKGVRRVTTILWNT